MSDLNSESVYKEICQNIRETDSISFKLLNLVPLGSTLGGGLLTILQKNSLLPIVLLSLAGAIIVLGLYIWELRNLQKCNWLIARAADLEPQGAVQYKGWDEQTKTWSKTLAESLIYSASMFIWLIPIVMR
jgi:hypothetical protein